MAGAKELHANIVLGGKVASSFWQLSNAIGTLGSALTDIGTASFDFLEECANKYAEFEDVMMDAQNAYKATFEGSVQAFNDGMEEMFDAAYKWSANSRFELMDVANAIASTAHAGKTMEETAGYMEAAMNLSLVGSMDLTSGLDMLIKTSNAFGLSFEEAVDFVDMWTYAANSAATDASEMGEAMEKLGGMMRMGTPSEILTLLGQLANMGTTGSEAGGMLKTTMLRIIAPTNTANRTLEELEITAEELSDAIGDDIEALADAQGILSSVGFSAYDDEGKLKSFITVYEDLYRALYAVDEEGAQLITEAERNSILKTVFGMRGFVGISNIMAGLQKDENSLSEANEKIENSLGYASEAAETRMNDLKGKMTELDNKIEVIKTRIGENVAPELGKVIDVLDGIAGKIAELDDGKLNAFVTALEGLSIGAGLFIGMGAIAKGLALIATPAGWIAAAAVGVATFVAVINELSKEDFTENFGTLTLDNTLLQAQIDAITNSYATASEEMIEFKAALTETVTAYNEAAANLSGTLHTYLITSATITPEDKQALTDAGEELIELMFGTVDSRAALNMATLNNYLANGELSTEDVGIITNLQMALYNGFSATIEDATTLSQSLRTAMTSAFDDGHLTSEEMANISSILDEMNQIVNDNATIELRVSREELLRRNELSYDNIFGTISELNELEEETVNNIQHDFLNDIETFKLWAEKAEERGSYGTDLEGNPATSEYWQTQADLTEQLMENAIAQARAENDKLILNLFYELLNDSDYDVPSNLSAGVYPALDEMVLPLLSQSDGDEKTSKLIIGNISDWWKFNQGQIENKIPEDNTIPFDIMLDELIEYKNEYQAKRKEKLQEELLPYLEYKRLNENNDYQLQPVTYDNQQAISTIDALVAGSTLYSGSFFKHMSNNRSFSEIYKTTPMQIADKDLIGNTIAQITENPVSVPIEADEESISSARGQIETIMGTTVMMRVAISNYVSAATQAYNYIKNKLSQPINVSINYTGVGSGQINRDALYAEGGRATQASIFGEAGAEWAIPEQHTARTKTLLLQAAEASGFSWGELISSRGGLGGGGNRTEVNYSPTIVTNDANGVKAALREDKARFEKWWRERSTREEVGAYE